jgi:predicted metal-dependent HD superfamily phosphohydrolase
LSLIDFAVKQVRFLYDLPVRGYHGLAHIHDCLCELDAYTSDNRSVAPEFLLKAELSLLYHDIIYIPGYDQNEEKSSEVLMMHCGVLEVLFKFVCECTEAILSTKHKYPYPFSYELPKITSDIDLSILGAAPEKYDTYKNGIRSEFASVPLGTYINGRIAFLENRLLSREKIYQTEYFFNKYEALARLNIAQEIEALRETIC